jgi:predicted dehydrogenase
MMEVCESIIRHPWSIIHHPSSIHCREHMRIPKRLGVGFIGSGFNTRFHIQAWQGVRDADVRGIWSPNQKNAASAAKLANDLHVGPAKAYKSITEMVADPEIHAIWLCGPNQARIENVQEICDAVMSGKGELIGIACEKPLARGVAEAKQVLAMVKKAKLQHGYLENQLFSPGIVRGRDLIWARGASTTGRPYLARAAEEHSGPHNAWFWQGEKQGGGVLNDMMCHSVEVVRFLLTQPGKPRDTLRPVSVNGRIASLGGADRRMPSSSRRASGKRSTISSGRVRTSRASPSRTRRPRG